MLKIGLIGSNHLVEKHIQLLREIDDFEIIGVYANNEEERVELANKMKIKSFNNVNDLIKSVDVVDIITSAANHFEYAVNAIKQSKHIFIEKPVVKTIEETKQLFALAEEANVKVQVGHVERFNPAFRTALPYISYPMFIETHRMIKFDTRKADISVIMDVMSHDIDIVLSVVKSNIKKISATGVEVIGNTPDVVNAVVEFDNGCVANLTASRVSLKNERISKFYQKDAHVKIDYLKQETNLFSLNANKHIGIIAEQLEIHKECAIKTELQEFADSINNNTPPIVGLHDVGVMLYAAYQVAEKMKITTSLIED